MVDQLSFVIQECTFMISAMRKSAKSPSGPLAIFLGSQSAGDGHAFLADDSQLKLPSFLKGSPKSKDDDHFLSGFVQLRSILSEVDSIEQVDILTLVQPFILLIRSASISCNITNVAIGSLSLFFKYGIIHSKRENIEQCLSQVVSALSHCRFEGSDQAQDDILLVKIIQLLEQLATSPQLSVYLRDESMYEILSTSLSVAINTRRREMLRSAATMSLLNVTEKVFSRLDEVEEQEDEDHNVKSTDFELEAAEGTQLPADTFGGTESIKENVTGESAVTSPKVETSAEAAETASTEKTTVAVSAQSQDTSVGDVGEIEEFKPYGVPCMREYLSHVVDLLSPQNKFRFTESTKLLALEIMGRVVQVSGSSLQKLPSLSQLVADRCCHHLVQLIRTSDSSAVLTRSLKLFLDLLMNAPEHLKRQFEMLFQSIMNNIITEWTLLDEDLDKYADGVFGVPKKKGEADDEETLTDKAVTRLEKEFEHTKQPRSKELLIEGLSVLWCRSPYMFINLFKAYDCDFSRSDLSLSFIKLLCRLSEPDSALFTTGNVPQFCMEGLLSLVDGIFKRVKASLKNHSDISKLEMPELLLQRHKKAGFLRCVKRWNEKPKDGLRMLQEEGFIHNTSDDEEVAAFLFNESSGLDKAVLGDFLARPANIGIMKEFMKHIDFAHLRPDEALRSLLSNFRLPGEAQQISRIVETFNDRYIECQHYTEKTPGSEKKEEEEKKKKKRNDVDAKTDEEEALLEDEDKVVLDNDALFVLAFSIIMLNTDLHNPNVKEPMTFEQYKKNLGGCYKEGDFPVWYIERIYQSIKEKEIILLDDFKGSNQWFENEWRSIAANQESVSSAGDEPFSLVSANGDSPEQLLQYDREIFLSTARYLVSTLVSMFNTASHDSVTTRMMSTIEKCATIATFFGERSIADSIVEIVCHMTTLTGKTPSRFAAELEEHVPTVQVVTDTEKGTYTVSELSIVFGRDFKAQLSLIVLLRILKRTEYRVSGQWSTVLHVLLKLFENDLVSPNAFYEFQNKLGLGRLPSPKPQFRLNRSKTTDAGGLLSTFSSYLRGFSDDTPEPTEDEIEYTMSALECVRSSKAGDLFQNVSKTPAENLDRMISLLFAQLPKKGDKFFMEKVLWLLETSVCYLLLTENDKLVAEGLEKCEAAFKPDLKLPPAVLARLTAYELLLLRVSGPESEPQLDRCLSRISASLDKGQESFLATSAVVLQPLELLVSSQDSWCANKLSTLPEYWKIMRAFASDPKNTTAVYQFMETLLKQSGKRIVNYDNYMDVLGLLDEISAVGAYGAQWEQDSDKLNRTGKEVARGQNPYQELVNTANESIDLTCKLAEIIQTPSFAESMDKVTTASGKEQIDPWYPLIEAVSHQCYNPCREVRRFAYKSLTKLLVSDPLPIKKLSPEALVDAGCFRLLAELSKPEVTHTDADGMLKTQEDVINLACKSVLLYEFDDVNKQVRKLLLLTDKLLAKNGTNRNFRENVVEIIKNALSVKKDELDYATLGRLKIGKSLKEVIARLIEENAPAPPQEEPVVSESKESTPVDPQPVAITQE